MYRSARIAVVLTALLTSSCTVLSRYDYWTVSETTPMWQTCGQLLWDAKIQHIAGDLTFAAKAVSPVDWDDIHLHLCTKPGRTAAVSMGPIVPIIPTPAPFATEGSASSEEIGIIVLNRANSRLIRIDPTAVHLSAGGRALRPLGFAADSNDCERNADSSPEPLELEPGTVATFCFEAPSKSVERIEFELLPDRPLLSLDRDRGTFLFVLE